MLIGCDASRCAAVYDGYFEGVCLHEWTNSRYETDDLSGTWYEVDVGTIFNVMDNLHISGNLRTSHGGEIDTDYRLNLVVRYNF